MAYITSTELSNRYAWWDFALDDNASGSADASAQTEVIELADSYVDSAAMQHYDVPLALGDAETANVVKLMSGTFAGWIAAIRRSDQAVLDALREDYTKAQEWLDDMKAGKVDLPGEVKRTKDSPGGQILIEDDARVMTRTNMAKF